MPPRAGHRRAQRDHRAVRADLRGLAAGLRRDRERPGGALPHGGHRRAGPRRPSPSTRRSTSCRWCTRRRRPATPTRSRRSARPCGSTGALFYLDAVASVGAEPVLPDAWGVDLCVIGAQKAMGGPAGVSAVSVSERAWARMAANPEAPRRSYLSLLDWKERWIDGGRKALLHAPAQLEMLALEACVERIEADGPGHGDGAARGGRGGDPGGRARRWAAGWSRTCTRRGRRRRSPRRCGRRRGSVASELVARALEADPALPLAAGGGALAKEMIRVNHYGPTRRRRRCRAVWRRWAPRWPSRGWRWTWRRRCGPRRPGGGSGGGLPLAPAVPTRPSILRALPLPLTAGAAPPDPAIGPKGLVLKRRTGWKCRDRSCNVPPPADARAVRATLHV